MVGKLENALMKLLNMRSKRVLRALVWRRAKPLNFIIKGLVCAASELICVQRCAALELGGCKPWEFREATRTRVGVRALLLLSTEWRVAGPDFSWLHRARNDAYGVYVDGLKKRLCDMILGNTHKSSDINKEIWQFITILKISLWKSDNYAAFNYKNYQCYPCSKPTR